MRYCCLFFHLFFCVCSLADARVGLQLKQLVVKDTIYYRVKVTKVTPRAITIFHSKGISQVMLKDLSPELQKRFGFDPASAAKFEKEIAEQKKREEAAAKARLEKEKAKAVASDNAQNLVDIEDEVLKRFGQPPIIHKGVDMRKNFNLLELNTKDQGRRPSCSIFAVVSALEYQNAGLTKKAEKLSEEYLIWATRKYLGLIAKDGVRKRVGVEMNEEGDVGFSLLEVAQALRVYGIPLAEQMPNTYGKSMSKIEEPSVELIEVARTRRKVFPILLTGREKKERVDNVFHVLNEGIPIVIGIAWPNNRTLTNAPVLSKQKPVSNHAVTLVGYKAEKGIKEETVFIFKNSYGRRWGSGGYGFINYSYLVEHMNTAVFLTVKF